MTEVSEGSLFHKLRTIDYFHWRPISPSAKTLPENIKSNIQRPLYLALGYKEFIFNFHLVVKEIEPFSPVIKLAKLPENIKFILIKTH